MYIINETVYKWFTLKCVLYPCVVEAVTDTTIIVACVKNCCNVSLFFAWSKSFPSSLTVQTYSKGETTSESNSGNLF